MLIGCGPPSPFSKVLKIHASGYPIAWISHQDAARLITNDDIAYAYHEDDVIRLHGGRSSMTGMRSFLDIPPILAINGNKGTSTILTFDDYTIYDELIFRRDRMRCAYCTAKVKMLRLDKMSILERNRVRHEVATKDHILPQSRGGRDTWVNLVTSCGPCNHAKADRTPEEAAMPLRYAPFKPNRYEYMCLTNKHMLPSQLAFLWRHFSRRSRHEASSVIPECL